jgi:leucyl-tRNA synthetase
LAGVAPVAGSDGEALAVSKAAHKTVKLVGEDIEKLAFNKAVARLYELVNALQPAQAKVNAGEADAAMRGACRQALEMLVIMVAPMMPHLAEECWSVLSGSGFVAEQPWPKFDAALTVDNEIVYPVQINGKKRADLTIARDADQVTVEQAALALETVQRALEGKSPRKVIVVPQRIVNVVV